MGSIICFQRYSLLLIEHETSKCLVDNHLKLLQSMLANFCANYTKNWSLIRLTLFFHINVNTCAAFNTENFVISVDSITSL